MVDIQSNPNNPAPLDILQNIVSLPVSYITFEGLVRSGVIEVHKVLEDDVRLFFELALEIKFPIEQVVRSSDPSYGWDDSKLVAGNASSGFNYRLIKGTDRPSLHGVGQAVDINPRLNPYIRYDSNGMVSVDPDGAIYDPAQPGVLSADHPLVTFMRDRGWEWGGDWTKESGRIDYQHFQKTM